MNQIAANLLASLSLGRIESESKDQESNDVVRVLAKVYEVARNALEYRADHLVRRAAIARILKRQLVFGRNHNQVADALLQELRWARYVADPKAESILVTEIGAIVAKYDKIWADGSVDRDWLTGLISAEIEEKLSFNADFHKFTPFAFHILKSRVRIPDEENLDLMLYVAVDKVFSQSDNEQVSYHLMKLIRSQSESEAKMPMDKMLQHVYKYHQMAMFSPVMNRLSVFVRKQIGPMVLLRDMYFAEPERFTLLLEDDRLFSVSADAVLDQQMLRMRGRLNRATVRSLMYVFLTKMLLVLVVEIPVERLLRGDAGLWTLAVNLILPVAIMWGLTARIRLPGEKEQEALKQAAMDLVFQDEDYAPEGFLLLSLDQRGSVVMMSLYYLFYGGLFLGIFAGLIWLLTQAGFSWISQVVFLFFLCLVTFFAFRIKQTAMSYSYKPQTRGYSFLDNLMLPIVTVGGMLSQGVSKMNFLVFVFDFVLEAPFKIILHFLDKWFAFLNIKKDEVVG